MSAIGAATLLVASALRLDKTAGTLRAPAATTALLTQAPMPQTQPNQPAPQPSGAVASGQQVEQTRGDRERAQDTAATKQQDVLALRYLHYAWAYCAIAAGLVVCWYSATRAEGFALGLAVAGCVYVASGCGGIYLARRKP